MLTQYQHHGLTINVKHARISCAEATGRDASGEVTGIAYIAGKIAVDGVEDSADFTFRVDANGSRIEGGDDHGTSAFHAFVQRAASHLGVCANADEAVADLPAKIAEHLKIRGMLELSETTGMLVIDEGLPPLRGYDVTAAVPMSESVRWPLWHRLRTTAAGLFR